MEYKKILHGLDGSEGSFKALESALEIAARCGAELHTISVEEVPHYPGTVGEVVEAKDMENGRYAKAVAKAQSMAEERGMELKCHVFVAHEVKAVVEFVKAERFDLLVIGFMGHSAIYERVMGSTCQSLVRMAPCSVLVVK